MVMSKLGTCGFSVPVACGMYSWYCLLCLLCLLCGYGVWHRQEQCLHARMCGASHVLALRPTYTRAQERFEQVKSTLAPFLKATCGFREDKVQWLPAVGPAGLNLAAPPTQVTAMCTFVHSHL